ncbi:MAG TPA: VWA domain-containing protein [Candidatus Limnocylindrales bacterium]|nr:VWA domain-containing protein [Candidatus Limnocylindrales bacterium]
MTAFSPDPRDLETPGASGARRDPLLARAARYARWDGTQTIPALDADEILDALAEDVMAEGDLAEALRRLMERGRRSSDPTRPDLPGLNELRERLRRRREDIQERYQLRDVLADVRRELDEIVAQERAGIERRLDEAAAPSDGSPADPALRAMLRDAAARRIDQLDALPRDVGARIRELEEYDFMEPAARDRFNELTEKLRKQTLDRFVEGLSESIQGMTPEDLDANRDMVRDLNALLEERLEGNEPGQDRVDEFLGRHGRFFPAARTLDDIVEQLTARMAAMQSLLRSMTPQQRAELQSMMDALLRDDRLRWDLARLASNIDQLMPDGVGESYDFGGDEPLGLEPALERIAQLQSLDALEDELAAIESPADLGGIDRSSVSELLGPDAARDLEALDDLARRLEEAGYLARRGEKLELTPRGSRRIGQKVLDDLFAKLSRDAFGGHRIDRTGRGGEREETTKPYEFGDPFHLDIRGTIENALRRPENAPFERLARAEPGVHLAPGDFEVFRTETLTKTSTVLLVDMSRSMLLRGCFLAAKKVAVALDTLIRTQFPRDDLTVIGFAYYARELRPEALAELTWHGYEYGTNLQHGLMLARRILAKQRGGNRQVVVITDGEPTAHFENGQVEFSYPPTRRTIQETLREVQRCTRDGITINTFMLERSRALAEFVALVTRLNRGRAFYATPEHLGEYVLVDFVSGRTRGVG